jgi:hypothetical protein
MRFWRAIAIACLGIAALETLAAIRGLVGAVQSMSEHGWRASTLVFGFEGVQPWIVITIPAALFALVAHVRLRDEALGPARLAGAATVLLVASCLVLVGLSLSST